MSDRLPDIIRPLHLAETRQILSGHLPLEKMSRLATVLRNPQDCVAVELEFGIDEQKIRYARGHLQTTLDLTCQRCFMSMPLAVNSELTMGFITTLDEADLLPESYEPVLVQESGCSLLELVEDELLLSLPLVVRHKESECQIKQDYIAAYDDDHEVPVENPFAVLERLKKGK
jgi:DUF177 domain-containing protein